jgi:hypothetical protein
MMAADGEKQMAVDSRLPDSMTPTPAPFRARSASTLPPKRGPMITELLPTVAIGALFRVRCSLAVQGRGLGDASRQCGH